MLIKKILPLLFAVALPAFLLAQVTTSSVTGTVKTKNGGDLEGASITAIHTPSGSKYVGVTKKGGAFTLPGLRVGGPYQITVNYVGLPSQTVDNITLTLGDPFNINFVMDDKGAQLSEVVVSANNSKRHAAIDRIGAATNISNRQIMTLPSISRSITDFTKLTPQANGTSFGGRDGRYNNVQIDGANLNNGFGLSSDPLPGGGVMPISIDAIQEISVNLSPYDVRQSNFTGAGISAITKSGDNSFKGTFYGYYRDQSYNGTHVNDFTLPPFQATTNKTYGGSLGGPIIKNKVFFFFNYETEEKTAPGIQFRPSQPGLASGSNVSSTPIDSLVKLSNYLKSTYNFDPGAYDNFPNFVQKDHKFLIRIDWNISTKTKLTVKYSELKNQDQTTENATSIDGTGLPKGASTIVPNGFSRMANSRFGTSSMSFFNSNYGTNYEVKSGSLELNSSVNSRLSNQFLATYTRTQNTRYVPGGVFFPTIDILNNNTLNYLSAGTDPFTKNNDIINEVLSITDNVSYYAGKHSITGGLSYEYQRYGNMFMAGAQSYYVFNTLNDFVTNQAPVYYAYTYSLVAGQPAIYSANLKVGQFGGYLQDEYTVNNRLKLTFGLRVERPSYIENPLTNPTILALTFPDKDGNPTHYNTGMWPTPSLYFSPRAGFRWDVKGDKSLIVRGGSGLFTGRIPYVYLTNMPSNSFMYQATASISNQAQLQGYKFNPSSTGQFEAHPADFPNTAGGPLPAGPGLVFINPNFKFPQVWRSNVGFDNRIGGGWTWSVEAMVTKDVNAVWMRNANQAAPGLTFSGADNRPYYGSASNKINSAIGTAIVLENTDKGLSMSYTVGIAKEPTKGFYGSLAYTYTFAEDVTANPGSTASSVWNSNPTTLTQNDLQLANSQYAVPHRVVGNLSYRFEYAHHLATTVSMFLQGQTQGTFSYIYSGDVNGDANSQDLMYIPKDPSQITFVALAASGTTPAFTAQQQSDAFFAYIAQDKYLTKHKGQYAQRNGVVEPFYMRADMKILQDLFANIGGRRHTIQLSLDILNLPNLLNRHWGVQKFFVSNSPLIFKSVVGGVPTFNMRTFNGALMNATYIDDQSTFSTWGAQVGLRYTF